MSALEIKSWGRRWETGPMYCCNLLSNTLDRLDLSFLQSESSSSYTQTRSALHHMGLRPPLLYFHLWGHSMIIFLVKWISTVSVSHLFPTYVRVYILRDFIVLDITNPGGHQCSLGFLTDLRRMCVAPSRARASLLNRWAQKYGRRELPIERIKGVGETGTSTPPCNVQACHSWSSCRWLPARVWYSWHLFRVDTARWRTGSLKTSDE